MAAHAIGAHPLWTVFLLALVVRAVVAGYVAMRFGGALFGDDANYVHIARDVAAGNTAEWGYRYHKLLHNNGSFLLPIVALFKVFGPHPILAQLLAAVFGSLAAVLTAQLGVMVVGRRIGVAAGLIVALLPSLVLWSSLVLKESLVWALLAGIALLVALVPRLSGRRLFAAAAAIVSLLLLLSFLRQHTLILAAWSLVLVALLLPRRRFQHTAIAVLVALAIPWATGLGVGGEHFVRGTRDLGEVRADNAQDANTALVPTRRGTSSNTNPDPSASASASPTDQSSSDPSGDTGKSGSGGAADQDGADSSTGRYVFRGIAVMLVEPLPWQQVDNSRVRLARAETVVWYPVLLLALIGLPRIFRRAGELHFPIFMGGGSLLVYAMAEGNFGTAYRHRAEFTWVVALLAAAGIAAVADGITRRCQASRSLLAAAGQTVDPSVAHSRREMRPDNDASASHLAKATVRNADDMQ